jgi:hypothetical protein
VEATGAELERLRARVALLGRMLATPESGK